MKKTFEINALDNVMIALTDLNTNDMVDDILIKQTIPFGHKIANKPIDKGDSVIKYGSIIGKASIDIARGDWVHDHNCKTDLKHHETYHYHPPIKEVKAAASSTFLGYRRDNGKVGIRNEIWIIPTVGCVNDVVKGIEREAQALIVKGIDGIVSFQHPYGCSQVGKDQINTQKILADLASHPNTAGVLLVGLGCENSGVDQVMQYVSLEQSVLIKCLICQQVEDEIGAGLALISELIKLNRVNQREEISTSELVIGLKCGGSDALSGVSANPVVGRFSDLLIATGGTTILTEVPEMFGAERLLMNRCQNRQIFNKTVNLINDFKRYYIENNTPIYENPSPGNKGGGISTLEEKSLGCTEKSGTSHVVDVLAYGDQVRVKGLNLLSSPGNDLVASTALAASGAHIVLFTTGRGTPFASPVPTVKISSNSALYDKKQNWIDFNAGELLKGISLNEMGESLFSFVINIASGQKVKSEKSGYRDMAIFKTGVTL